MYDFQEESEAGSDPLYHELTVRNGMFSKIVGRETPPLMQAVGFPSSPLAADPASAYIRFDGLRFPAGETFPRGLIDP